MPLSCRDLGFRCSFSVSGKDHAEMKRKLDEHAHSTHKKHMHTMGDYEREKRERQIGLMLASQRRI